jgi:hypothetical protein
MKPTVLRASEARELAALPIGGRMVLRRKVRPQPDTQGLGRGFPYWNIPEANNPLLCPLGSPGEVRWVKEPWIEGFPTGEPRRWSCIKPTHFDGNGKPFGKPFYRADGEDDPDQPQRPWKPAVSMPKWASRMNLRNVSMSVERDSSGVWWWRQEIERVEKEG